MASKTKITSKSAAFEVRQETARRTNQSKWLDNDEWEDFLHARAGFFGTHNVLRELTDSEKRFYRKEFTDWLSVGDDWWRGKWGEKRDLFEWHLREYQRARKRRSKRKKQDTSDAQQVVAPPEPAEEVEADGTTETQPGEAWGPAESEQQVAGVSQPTKGYYDYVSDSFR